MLLLSGLDLLTDKNLPVQIAAYAGDKSIWTFEGALGAGKTTLIKSICRHFDVTDEVSSPSFSLVNEYRSEKLGKIYHFDFYRVRSPEEAYDIGFDEYLSSGSLCLIEWPDKIAPLLQNEVTLDIRIEVNADQSRELRLR